MPVQSSIPNEIPRNLAQVFYIVQSDDLVCSTRGVFHYSMLLVLVVQKQISQQRPFRKLASCDARLRVETRGLLKVAV